MPSTEFLRNRLREKLDDLFQLNQPDLDFGFYRIMHAKAEQVKAFIDNDLLQIVADAFGDVDAERKRALEEKYDRILREAREEYNVAEPENTKKAKAAKQELDEFAQNARGEADIYDHLYRFFERYYDDGDFISRRYYTRETPGKAAPFAIPYNGEEVKLYWANADQYYIKTTEYFNNFTFDLRQAVALEQKKEMLLTETGEQTSLRVHFRIVDATEGEHGNIKATDATKRFFLLHKREPIATNDAGELIANFEYRSDPEKTGQDKTWQDKRNKESVTGILAALHDLGKQSNRFREYLSLLQTPAPTEADDKRILLAKYVYKYTARNTMDYFIHKDLGGFLRRELDFYIKNEMMRLDDIDNADAPSVESWLAKVQVMRRIALKLIDFLAQLEDFQKKLWLKKKFVVETNYCITLDRVPEELYEEIAANDAQREEWVRLFAIDEIAPDAQGAPGYTTPLTVPFLLANTNLLLDTKFFDDEFKARLLASIENFDEQCDGLLIHSENFQALNLLQERYREQVKCIYIDPPYNTSSTPILYKNEYQHASWATMMWDRLAVSRRILREDGVQSVAIDDTEMLNLSKILEDMNPDSRVSRVTVIHNPKGSITKDFNRVHEYAVFITSKTDSNAIQRTLEDNEVPRKMRRWGANSTRIERPRSFYPIYVKNSAIEMIGDVPSDDFHPTGRNEAQEDGTTAIWPIDQDGVERRWNFGLESVHENLDRIAVGEVDGTLDLFVTKELTVPKTVWSGGEFDAGTYGNTLLINILGMKLFDYPKSINLVMKSIGVTTGGYPGSIVVDYFGGSGTTAHATIDLNRKGGERKYILVEIGNHFDRVLKPRTEKVIYSSNWRDGKPISRNTGISHCFKYLRLESYEDTLNNLSLNDDRVREAMLKNNAPLRESYMLNYMLDVETRGSKSLLNLDAFNDPTAYTLQIKKPGSDEYETRTVDLIETFNYLIGLRVEQIHAPVRFNADLKREHDPELPDDQHTRKILEGRLRLNADGEWWFRSIEGWVPSNPASPNNGQRDRVLIIWRKLTGDLEEDNAVLDAYLQRFRVNPSEQEYDLIYVNGSNNLTNRSVPGKERLEKQSESDATWKVRLIEEEFLKRMWDVEGL